HQFHQETEMPVGRTKRQVLPKYHASYFARLDIPALLPVSFASFSTRTQLPPYNRLYSDYGILRGIPRKEKVDADEICRGQPKRTEVLGSHEPDRRRVSAAIACI